mgnify:CR=1 FL=1
MNNKLQPLPILIDNEGIPKDTHFEEYKSSISLIWNLSNLIDRN